MYRAIRQTKARKILEIGIGNPARTTRLLHLACRLAEGESVRYAAIDLFEARPQSGATPLSLKEAHRLFKSTPAQVQLVPGDPPGALARVANSLPNVDLVLISSETSEASLAGAWFYVPRMLHAASAVYRELPAEKGGTLVTPLAMADIQSRVAADRRRAA